MISIVLFDGNVNFLTDIQKKLRDQNKVKVIASTRDFSELEAMLRKNRVEILIFGPSIKGEDMVSLGEEVSVNYPQVGIILISSNVTADLLREALRTGIKDVLPASITTKQLVAAIERAYQHSLRIHNAVADFKLQSSTTETKALQPAKVITFFSAKGGVGKTVIATNLGVALAQQTKSRVVLLDLNLQFGDVAVMLQLMPVHTIYEVVSSMSRLDAEMMKGFLTAHGSGLETLLAPVQPDQADAVSSEDVIRIVEVLRGMCDYLLIDTPPSFNDHVLAALDHSDEICLVATLDVPSLKNTKLSLHMLDLLQYPKEKIKLLLNRADSKVRLSLKDVEQSLEMKATATIPSDIIVPLSVNKGTPVITGAPRSPVSRSLYRLVEEIKNRDGVAASDAKIRVAAST